MDYEVNFAVAGGYKNFIFSAKFLEEDDSFLGTIWKFHNDRKKFVIVNSITENELNAIHYLYDNGIWDSKYFSQENALTREQLCVLSDYMCIEPYYIGMVLDDGSIVDESDEEEDGYTKEEQEEIDAFAKQLEKEMFEQQENEEFERELRMSLTYADMCIEENTRFV